MANTLYVKRAIADYIIEVLGNVDALNDIAVFIRGGLPSGMIPQDKYPFCEVIVAEETPDAEQAELTGGYYVQVYTGIVTASVLLTEISPGDWLEPVGEREARVPSYDLVEEYVYAIMAELQKCEHRDMGALTLNHESVTHFALIGPRIYGIDRDARTNSWENFGSVPFEVQTIRSR